MKQNKIFSLLLAGLLVLCLAGCQSKEKESDDLASVSSLPHSMNILGYAERGQIPELPFKLGESVQTVKDEFMDHVESGSEIIGLEISEGDKTVWMQGGSMIFCYEKAKEEAGISVLVAQEYGYDFSLGGVYAVDDVISAVGSEAYTRAATGYADAFFLPIIPEGSECLTYKVDAFELRFIFIDGYLSAVTLTDPANWTE